MGSKTVILGTRSKSASLLARKEMPYSRRFFKIGILGNPFPLFRGKLDALFFFEGCERPGYTLGFISGWELLAEKFLKRGRRRFCAAPSAHNGSIVT